MGREVLMFENKTRGAPVYVKYPGVLPDADDDGNPVIERGHNREPYPGRSLFSPDNIEQPKDAAEH